MSEIEYIFDDIKASISDLDLIFFSGTEIISRAIVLAEKIALGEGNWSHVGLVISKKHLTNLNIKNSTVNKADSDDTLYIWESTMSSTNSLITSDPTVDAESNTGVFGVQIRPLNDVIINSLKSNVGIGWAKLLNNPLCEKIDETDDIYKTRFDNSIKILNKLHETYYHKPYPKNIIKKTGVFFWD